MHILHPKTHYQTFPKLKTVKTALEVTENATARTRGLLRAAMPDGLSDQQATDLRQVLGLGRQPPINSFASNTHVRSLLVPRFIEVLMRTWSLLCERQMQFLTIAPDGWHIDEERPILRPKAWREEAARWLAQLGFTGMGFIEFAPYLNHPSARHGRVLSGHLHAVGFADDESTYRRKITRLSDRLEGLNAIGNFAVNRPVNLTEGDLAMVARYLIDQLRYAKRLSPSRKNPGRFVTRDAELPLHLALRSAEILTYLKFTDLIVTRGGTGWQWRQELIRSVGPALTQASLVREDLDDLWCAVWRLKDREHYMRVSRP